MTDGFADFKAPGGKPLINSIFDFSAEALSELRLYLEQNPPAVPISSILGFSQFTAKSDSVAASQTTASATYTNLATVGPTISSLPDGQYVVFCIARIAASAAGVDTLMGVKVNSTEASDADSAYTQSANGSSVVQASLQSLSNAGNNTLLARYRSAAGTATFANRRLVALKYANL